MTRIRRTEALCLRIAPSGRTSRIVTWLSPDFGCLTTLVKGSCRPKSAFLGQFDLYYSCELLYYARDADRMHIARECTPLILREPLRGNWRAVAAASYLCDLTRQVCPPDLEASAAYRGLTETLDRMAAGGDPLLLLLWFECRLLAAQGLAPQLHPCPLCRDEAPAPDMRRLHEAPIAYSLKHAKRTETARFSLGSGRLVCPHRPGGIPDDSIALPETVMQTLRSWQRRDAPPDMAQPADAGTLLGLRRFLGLYVMYHFEPAASPRRIVLSLLGRGSARGGHASKACCQQTDSPSPLLADSFPL